MLNPNTSLPIPQPASIPADEPERLAALRRLCLLDSPPSEFFDRITQLATQLLDVPAALVSLVDENRQWFKSRQGLDATETPRKVSFCAHAVYERQVLNVPDATQDPRFAGNPLVIGEPDIRAYLGVPLYTQGDHAIGTLCVFDRRARGFDEQSVSALENLARVLEDHIRSKAQLASLKHDLQLADAQEALFRDTFDQAPVGIVHTDLWGRLLRVNQSACSMLGYTNTELAAMSFVDIAHPDDLVANIALFKQMVAGKLDRYSLENRFVCKNGTFLWANLSAALKRSDSSEPDYIISVVEDITERKQAEVELLARHASLQAELVGKTSSLQSTNNELQTHIKQVLASEHSVRLIERRLRSISDNLPVIIAYWSRELTCEFANTACCSSFGLSPKNIIGMKLQDVLGEMLFETVEAHVSQTLSGQAQRFERTLTKPDGTEAILEMRFMPDFDGAADIRGFVALGTDISESRRERRELEAANLKLKKETATDFLTGISNRRIFSERTEEASQRFRSEGDVYGLILLDLDNFKQINDVHGHSIGDEVLRIVGRLLKRELRSHRDIAARLGGEEFAILCFGDLDAELLHLIAERVRQQLSKETIHIAGEVLTFTASFGLALSDVSDAGWKDIYARADMAMYEAKASGKDQVRFAKFDAPGATRGLKTRRLAAR